MSRISVDTEEYIKMIEVDGSFILELETFDDQLSLRFSQQRLIDLTNMYLEFLGIKHKAKEEVVRTIMLVAND